MTRYLTENMGVNDLGLGLHERPLNDSEDTQTMGPDPTMLLLGGMEHTVAQREGHTVRQPPAPPRRLRPPGALLPPRRNASPLRHARTRVYVPPPPR